MVAPSLFSFHLKIQNKFLIYNVRNWATFFHGGCIGNEKNSLDLIPFKHLNFKLMLTLVIIRVSGWYLVIKLNLKSAYLQGKLHISKKCMISSKNTKKVHTSKVHSFKEFNKHCISQVFLHTIELWNRPSVQLCHVI